MLLSVCLAGCYGPITWIRPDGVSVEQFRREEYECSRDAAMLPNANKLVFPSHKTVARDFYEYCMESKNYSQQK